MNRFVPAVLCVLWIIIFCLTESVEAQTIDGQDPTEDRIDRRFLPDFGIRAGINIANVWDEQGQEFVSGSNRGFAGGFYLSIPFGSYTGFQPEVLLSQKGYQRERVIEGETTVTFSRTASYIDIPFQIQLKPAPFLTILAGPHYSVLIIDDWDYDPELTDPAAEELTEGDLRNNLLGLGGGLDLEIRRIVISARAGWDLLANEGDGQTEEPRYKNRWLQITVGFRLS